MPPSEPSPSQKPKPGQLRAIISSTAFDLPAHRAAVIQACLGAGVFPIGMEHLPAQDANGIKVSLEMVEDADIYLGVYAWRYGWVPDFDNAGKISITEMEFDHAVVRQRAGELREILIFTAHENHPCTAKDVEADSDAQQKLAAFKTKAAVGRVRKEFASAEELQRLVGEALRAFIARTAITIPVASVPEEKKPRNTSIPNNLPRLQFFFGREADLKKIADALAPDARGWGALIDGPGGIGKTALAIRAAELVPAGRFQRIIFLSAKERELTADGQRALGHFVLPNYLEMLNAIARETGQADLVKLAGTERTEAILRALRDAEVLLVLDNLETLPADDRDQLFAFLNRLPRGSSAIVTSRRRADAGAVSIRLDRLDWEAARDLIGELGRNFVRLGQATDEERRALYDETGGNPLLIRWVAGQLGHGRYRTVAAALGLLRSPEAGNNPLEFVFGDLLDTFSPNETKVLAALTHFTLPIDVKFIAELGGLNEEAAHGALSDLSSRALVLPDLEERCFAIVPLVADFLRRKKPEVVAETGDRLEKRAYALIVENGYSKHDRFPVLDAAWPGVAPALPRFLGGPNDRLHAVCIALQDFLDFTGRWDEWLALNEQAEAKAVAAYNHHRAGWRVCQVGHVHSRRGQADAVLACADRAAAHWTVAKAGARERAVAIHLRGLGHQLKKDYPAAIASYREALDLWRSLSAESGDVVIALNGLAGAERLSGDFAPAERDYTQALRISRLIGHHQSVAALTGNLASLALDRENWPGAEALAREALPLSEKVGRQEMIAANCHHLAKALARQGKGAEGLPYAQRAVEIYQKLGSPYVESARTTLKQCEG